MRRTILVTAVLLTALVPAAADARTAVRVGIGDQQTAMFGHPGFDRLNIKRVRYFVPWNAMRHPAQRQAARAYVRAARAAGARVFVHISSHDIRVKRGKLPSVRQYRREVGRLVRYLRPLGVREWGVWNEANHASQETWNNPRRAASFYKVMYRLCRGCTIVALDVLDQRGVERYMRRWYSAAGRTYRRRARLIGIHNYGDVNRRRTRYTRSIIRTARRYNRGTRAWFTETGGIVKFGRSFPCSQRRAASRLNGMFSLAKRYRRTVKRLYIYNWTGAGCGARFDAGLTNADGSLRPGYSTVRNRLRSFMR